MKKRGIKFIPTTRTQLSFFPIDIASSIPENHLVKVIDRVIDSIDVSPLLDGYSEEGRPSFDPRVLLKLLLFAYSRKVYSCRKISREIRENIYYMYLAGGYQPCFKTINNFRSGHLKEKIEKIFQHLILFLLEEEYIDETVLFVDGTKIQADANKYTYVWKKNTLRYKESIFKRVSALLAFIDKVNKGEDTKFKDMDFPEKGDHINSSELDQKITELTEQIKEQEDKKRAKKLDQAKQRLNNELNKLTKYEEQEEHLADRNSYSKTDVDATFMRDKNDNLVACYNTQISTQGGFICHYTISQSASDQRAFHDHIMTLPEAITPEAYVGDAAYGTESNYMDLEEKGIESYLKYQDYYREQKGTKSKRYDRNDFVYNESSDTFICPNNKELIFEKERIDELVNGQISNKRIYICHECAGCQFKENCTSSKSNYRTLTINARLIKYRSKAKENLDSERGIEYRKQRGVDVETPFGDIKHNQGYRRFRLRGLKKVSIEMGLLAMSYNLRKIAIRLVKNTLFFKFVVVTIHTYCHRKNMAIR